MRFLLPGAAVFLLCGVLGTSVVHADALSNVREGNKAFSSGELVKAISDYTKAITSGELRGELLAITYNNRGVVLSEQGNLDRAIEDYNKALQLQPEDETTAKNLRIAYTRRSQTYLDNGDMETAKADLEMAISADEDHYLAYLRRAEIFVRQENLALAIADYKRALARNPGDADLKAALDTARSAIASNSPELVDDEPATTTTSVVGNQNVVVDATPSTAETVGASQNDLQPEQAAETSSEVPEGSTSSVAERQVSSLNNALLEANQTNSQETSGGQEEAPQQQSDTANEERELASVGAEQSSAEVEPTAPPAANRDFEAAGNGEAFETTAPVWVRGAPSNDGEIVGSATQGQLVTVYGETLGWKHVELSDGQKGYIYRRFLTPLAAAGSNQAQQ